MDALEEVRGRRGGEERGDAVVKLGECEDAHGEEVPDECAEGERVDGVCSASRVVAWCEAALALLEEFYIVSLRWICGRGKGKGGTYGPV